MLSCREHMDQITNGKKSWLLFYLNEYLLPLKKKKEKKRKDRKKKGKNFIDFWKPVNKI